MRHSPADSSCAVKLFWQDQSTSSLDDGRAGPFLASSGCLAIPKEQSGRKPDGKLAQENDLKVINEWQRRHNHPATTCQPEAKPAVIPPGHQSNVTESDAARRQRGHGRQLRLKMKTILRRPAQQTRAYVTPAVIVERNLVNVVAAVSFPDPHRSLSTARISSSVRPYSS